MGSVHVWTKTYLMITLAWSVTFGLPYFALYIPSTPWCHWNIDQVAQIAKKASSDTAVASSSCNNIFSWHSYKTRVWHYIHQWRKTLHQKGKKSLKLTAWMSQEVCKWLVSGLRPTNKWGILGLQPTYWPFTILSILTSGTSKYTVRFTLFDSVPTWVLWSTAEYTRVKVGVTAWSRNPPLFSWQVLYDYNQPVGTFPTRKKDTNLGDLVCDSSFEMST